MTGKEVMKVLGDLGITRDEFAGMMGIKRSTMRTCIYGNRISAKMVERLRVMSGEKEQEEEIAEVDAMIEEVVKPLEEVVRKMDKSDVREGKIYAIPKNPYLRLVEFRDGSHGKFRSKADAHLKLGEVISLRHVEKDMWEVVK